MKSNHTVKLNEIFSGLDSKTMRLAAREGGGVEFKQTFNWANKSSYGRSMAAFANKRGGYLIFGVTDKPRTLVGITGSSFESLDEANMASYLNGVFSPEILFEKFSYAVAGKVVGVIYTASCDDGPVVALKADGEIKEAEIYYRYNARNDKVKYPELRRIFDGVRERERQSWKSLFEKVASVGVTNAAILDTVRGTVSGSRQTILIDEKLLPKLKFINEGKLEERGEPVLRLVGDVRPIVVSGAKGVRGGVRLTDDPSAVAVREESILENYPLSYGDLVDALKKEFVDFKQDGKFHAARAELCKDPKLCRTRYLDPQKGKGTKKDFFSPAILAAFEKFYKRRG